MRQVFKLGRNLRALPARMVEIAPAEKPPPPRPSFEQHPITPRIRRPISHRVLNNVNVDPAPKRFVQSFPLRPFDNLINSEVRRLGTFAMQ